MQGIGAASAASAQAAGYKTDALLHDRQANLDRVKGGFDAARLTERGQQTIGAQVAGYASNGFGLSGTIADVVKQTGESAGLDVASARYGTKVDVENEQILAKVSRANAATAKASIPFAFAAPVLSGAATYLKTMYGPYSAAATADA